MHPQDRLVLARTQAAACAAVATALVAGPALAADDASLPAVVVTGHAPPEPAAPLGDTAATLASRPGVSVWSNGGVSGLPALRGLADDRVKVALDGAEATAACGNHMNPPLSYVDPTQLTQAQVVAGLSPVSLGGDNIGGVIAVTTTRPVFAAPGSGWRAGGQLSLDTRSVDQGRSLGLSAHAGNDAFAIGYSGSLAQADSYQDGHGRKVLDTLYRADNHALLLAARGQDQQLTLRAGVQRIPYQGFPTQYMDMTGNHSAFVNLGYDARFGWGRLEALVYGRNTVHEMGFFTPEKTGTMPMNTHGRDLGYKLKAEVPWQGGTLRLGHEWHRFRLDDWWPPVSGSMMMAPNAYWNIADGRRDRLALFGEWQGALAPRWSGLFGVRGESVRTDTGDVQGYGCGMMCAADDSAASAFNARDRHQRDANLDLAALATYTLGATAEIEVGAARKTRSPNLYERYSWGRGTMAMTMIGWFGDANGYLGNPDLKPEVAHTASTTLRWHDAQRSAWDVSVTPFYTYVKDYIDVDVIGSFAPYMRMGESKALLQFANHDAHLYGVNAAWTVQATRDGIFKGKVDVTRGTRSDGGSLYHQMPPALTLGWEQRIAAFTGTLEWVAVAGKHAVDTRRDEDSTAGYTLVNLSGRYAVTSLLTLRAGMRNLFDRAYDAPLGGAYLAGYQADTTATRIGPLPGAGRSIDVGMTLTF